MTERQRITICCGVTLAKSGQFSRLAVEEWLDGNKWAGEIYDRSCKSFSRFFADVKRVFDSHVKQGL